MRFIAGECTIGYPNCFSQTYTYEGIYGHISRFEMTLGRRFLDARRTVSFVNADCPAPAGASIAHRLLAVLSVSYPGQLLPEQIATRRCEVSRRHSR
jgi:hypothetical protein